MPTIKQATAQFLAGKRVAVTGVSRTPQGHGSNVVYQRLRQRGITVIEGGCPCMFGPTADPGHRAMRLVYTLTGNVPRHV